MSTKRIAKSATARATFAARKGAIKAIAAKFAAELEAYDRDISMIPDGHKDWGHAGSLASVLENMEEAMTALVSAREATQHKARRREEMRNWYK